MTSRLALAAALVLGACFPSRPAASAPRRDAALEAQRTALRKAETTVLGKRLDDALARENWLEAAQAVAAGFPLAPERFAAPVPKLLEVLPPATAAELAQVVGDASADALAAKAHHLALTERYASRTIPDDQVGIHADLGRAAITAARTKFVDPVDEEAWFRAANERLQTLGALWSVPVRTVPLTTPAPFGTLWKAGVEAGIPEPIVVGETTEAAFAVLDRWSRPVWPAEITEWTRGHDGIQVGTGVQLFDRDGAVVVGYPIPGSAAWEAGVRQDDVIVGIGGVRVAEFPSPAIDAVVDALHGPPGSTVAVTLSREGEHTVTLTRRAVPAETVVGYARGTDNAWTPWIDANRRVAYVRLRALRPHTVDAFDALVDGIDPRALILDLRGNAGGDLAATIDLADRFVADGLLAELTGRTVAEPVPKPGEVAWNAAVPGHPLEVLANPRKGAQLCVVVDEGTGSAAELLAGVLRARAGAVVVGARTFGKVATQVIDANPEQTVAWQITHARLTVPGEPPLTDGLVPDHVVELSPAEGVFVDVLLAKREHLRAHRDGSAIRYTGPEGDGTLPPLDRDPQLAMALAAVTLR